MDGFCVVWRHRQAFMAGVFSEEASFRAIIKCIKYYWETCSADLRPPNSSRWPPFYTSTF